MPRVTVDVTQSDIDAGKRDDCFCCPIAIAAHRATGIEDMGVWTDELFLLEYDETQLSVSLPDAAEYWVSRYDRGLPVKPFSFDVDFPRPGETR